MSATEITVNFTPDELISLMIVLNTTLGKLQNEYDANKDDSTFNKEDALRELEHLRGIIHKVNEAHDKPPK